MTRRSNTVALTQLLPLYQKEAFTTNDLVLSSTYGGTNFVSLSLVCVRLVDREETPNKYVSCYYPEYQSKAGLLSSMCGNHHIRFCFFFLCSSFCFFLCSFLCSFCFFFCSARCFAFSNSACFFCIHVPNGSPPITSRGMSE